MVNTKQIARDALKESNRQWKQLADSGDAGNWSAEEQAHYQASEKAIAALEAELARVVEPVKRELPKLTNSDFERPMAQGLQAAFIDGWASCRDSEYSGDGAQNDAFNQSDTLALCVAIDQSTAPPEPVNAWLPIETAPKNGTLVAVWCNKEPGIIRTAKWGISKSAPKSCGCWVTPSGNAISNIPTHWTPLPKATGATT